MSEQTHPYPDFFVVGAGKSGTTALYGLMRQHPDIFLPDQKQTHFFYCDGASPNFADKGAERLNATAIYDQEVYESLYAGQPGLKGEICPTYLAGPHVAKRIAEKCPNAKIMAILRDPIERSFSSYRFMKARGSESGTFEEALAAEPDHIRDNWQPLAHYTRASLYHPQLAAYYACFPAENIHVIEFERFSRAPEQVTNEALAFLGLSPLPEGIMMAQTNKTVVIENRMLAAVLDQNQKLSQVLRRILPKKYRARMKEWLLSKMKSKPETISEQTRTQLESVFAEDVRKTRELTGQPFEHWSL